MIGMRWVRGGGRRGAVALAVGVAALAGCDVPPPPAAAPGPVASPGAVRTPPAVSPTPSDGSSPCPEGGVRLREDGGDAAMGLRLEGYRLQNCGAQPYELNGYPEVRLLDERRRPVEVAVGHGSAPVTSEVPALDALPERVLLQPGQTASVAVVWRNLVTDATVPAVEGRVLELRPRPDAPWVTLALTRAVDLGNTGRLGIGPWRR